MKATIFRLKPNYKKFVSDIQREHFECKSTDVNENYEHFVQKLLKIINNHAPLK